MSKPYELGVVCGRFQHAHIGHEDLIDTALKMCDKVLVLIGSAQEYGTERNPYDVLTRAEIIKEIYPSSDVIVKPLNDLTTENDITPEWGKYFLSSVKQITDVPIGVMIYGNDESRSKWFAKEDIMNITEVIVNRGKIPISATMMRGFLVNNDEVNWRKYANPKIYKYYNRLRQELLAIPFYQKNEGKAKVVNVIKEYDLKRGMVG